MKINLKFKAMSILMAGLQETQMWAVYQMGMGNEMPLSVSKEDLTCIIAFLFKQLDSIDEGSPSHTSVESPIFLDIQKCENQVQKNSAQQITFDPDQNDDNMQSKEDGVNSSVEIAEDNTQVDQNNEQNQANYQVENNELLINSERDFGDDT